MSRKHFRALAEIFAGELSVNRDNVETCRAIRCVILSTADLCKQSNSDFNRARFYLASGLDASGQLV